MFKQINDWFASVLPGWKTQLASAVTVVSSLAAVTADATVAWTGDQWKMLVGEWAPYFTMFSGLAAMYFRMLANRVPVIAEKAPD